MKESNRYPEGLIGEVSRLLAEKLSVHVHSAEEDLLAAGTIDSLSLIQLLVSLEEYFKVRIPLEDLEIEDVRSIRSIARLVEGRKAAHAGADA
jgi:acyl carrier protein